MTRTEYQRLFWYCALTAGLALGSMPLFTHATPFDPLAILGGTVLVIVSSMYLKKPRRIRLPYRRTLS
jgi:hypothetical protein